MNGTGHLLRLAWRRDRWMVIGTLLMLWVLVLFSATATIELYPDTASRVAAATLANGLTSVVMSYGYVYDVESVAGLGGTKMQMIAFVILALLAVAVVRRHTRSDEETGRFELLGAGVVGRRAPLAAAVGFATIVSLVGGAGTAIAVGAGGLPWPGAWLMGAAGSGVGIAFAVICAIAVQLSASARIGGGFAYGALAVSFVLRMTGDVREGYPGEFLRWLSPLGWGQQVRAWNGDRVGVLGLFVGFGLLGFLVADRLRASRDLGAGIFPERPGRERGRIATSYGLSWRLHRFGLAGWTLVGVLIGLLAGALIGTMGDFLTGPAEEMLRGLGGAGAADQLFASVYAGLAAVVASAYGISAVLRAHDEEGLGHAELLLSTRESRRRLLSSHLLFGFGGSAGFMVAMGLAQMLVWSPGPESTVTASEAFGAALVQIPAIWVVISVAVAVVGLLPRAPWLAWVMFIAFIAVGELGALLELPRWVRDLSPYAHTPRMPAEPFELAPVLVLLAVGAGLLAVGAVAYGRRDLPA